MIGLFVTKPWPNFYKKGMKTWEIRNYKTDYRGSILIIESKTNKIIAKMILKDCIPLTKEMWEMNFDKHRVSCSFENLPYRENDKTVYAWVLENNIVYDEPIIIERNNRKPYMEIDSSVVLDKEFHTIRFPSEQIACKFIGSTMLLYWIKKDYIALIALLDLRTGNLDLVLDDIKENEVEYIVNQINANL